MNPTDILKNEHRVIEQVLNCLERMAEEARRYGELDIHSAREAIDFFRTFADGCHHHKEETHLFPAMEAKGLPRQGGPTGVMLYEHEAGRQHIRAMAEAVEAAVAGDQAARDRFSQHARDYIELLREHIGKEDHCLFGMAGQMFTPADQAALLAKFQRVEAEEMGEGTHEKYLDIANRLADRYCVARAKAAEAHGVCGCGHH
ncbi:MAG: hemerythrin domain-containing protein [Pirellulales bacterium]|nr:hemerythrin domain-containing protein [Pirellulales bacterium]